jgi:type IV secretion system protein VirB9
MLRFDYEIEGKDYDWKPVRVFDDGQKTFIQMPKNLRVTEAPVLFLLDDDAEPLIVNYRVKGDLYIVDRLLEQAELRVGTSKKVSISRDDGKNFFERLFS